MDITHNHITNAYLLGVAMQQGDKLATFDQRIPATVIQGGGAALGVIASH